MILNEELFESTLDEEYTIYAYELNNSTNRMDKTKVGARNTIEAAEEFAQIIAERISDASGENYVQIIDADGDEIKTFSSPVNPNANANIDDLKEATLAFDEEDELTEGAFKDLAFDIEEAGGKENWLKQMRSKISECKEILDYLKNVAPREVNRGGAYDSYEEISEALTEIEMALKELEAQEAIVSQVA